MDTQQAKRALAQFGQWMRAAEKMQEVVDHAASFERQAKEAEERHAGLVEALEAREGERKALVEEIKALRARAREEKLSIEHETKRLQERHREQRGALKRETKEAEAEATKRVKEAMERAEKAEKDADIREKWAKDAVAEAERQLTDIRKRLGSV